MKQIFLCLAVTSLVMACNNEQKEPAAAAKEETAGITVPNLSMPASYSSSFKLGNPEYAAAIVQGSWKDWDDNKLDNMKNWVADTVVAYQSDNSMVKGVDSLMAIWKRIRAGYTMVADTIDAVIPVYSTDKNEHWVLVWATAHGTKTDGTKETAAVMETWRINKDGKADLLLQFDRSPRKK